MALQEVEERIEDGNLPLDSLACLQQRLDRAGEFCDEEEPVESGYGQMAGKRDHSRLTVQVGRFAVHDIFDTNAYAMDPRADFMNWSIWAAGAFDYPADRVGLTYGAIAELNQKHWALRAGYFLTGNQPNSNEFDMNLFGRGGYVAELESRYALFSQSGKLRIGIWADTYFSGSYSQALDLVALNPGLVILVIHHTSLLTAA